MRKPNQASKDWAHGNFQHEKHQAINPSSYVRRCGRCEAFAATRQSATTMVWVSEVGEWYEVPNTGVQLNPIIIPPHHENEHFDNGILYGKVRGERGGRVSPNIPQDTLGAIGGRQ